MNYKKMKDLMVKLKYVFPKDIIIIKNKYCIAGNSSYLENYGYNIAILEEKQEKLIEETFGKNILITDVDEMKKAFNSETDYSSFYRELTEEEVSMNSNDIYNYLETCSGYEYTPFSKDENFKSVILDEKGIYDIEIENGDKIIRIGKPTLPLVSAKTINDYRYNIDYFELQNLYKLTIYLPFEYFQLYLNYDAVPMLNIK